MTPLEQKASDFLAQRRIAVVGVSRETSGHPSSQLIYRRLRHTGHDVFPVNPHMTTFEGDRCYPNGSSVSPAAVEFCRAHDITVIAGACPMMFGSGVDFGHTCLRFYLKLTGGLPT